MTTTIQIEEINGKFVLPLSSNLLEKLNVQNGGQVKAMISENSVVLRPSVADERDVEFKRLKEKMFDEYSEVFTALAEGLK